jgi:hypothetical protein
MAPDYQAGYPIISISIGRFSSRHTASPRERSTSRRGIDTGDYISIDDLLRASCNELNLGRFLPTVPVWIKISPLMLERSTGNVENNPQLEQQDLTTVILPMAKTVKEAKRRRKLNSYHRAFGKVLLGEDSGPLEDIFDICAITANRILPYYDARHISNLTCAYALIGYDPKLDNQTQL